MALRLPSLIVTLATLISLRGLAFVLVEERPIAGFPGAFVALGNQIDRAIRRAAIAGLAFLIVAIPIWFVLGLDRVGPLALCDRRQSPAARLSGIPIDG